VKGERADMSEMFGGGASKEPPAELPQGFVCPFLIFCGL
jgi:hypothetical protein